MVSKMVSCKDGACPNPVRELKRIWRDVSRRVKKYGLRRLDEREIAEEIERYRGSKGLID